MKRIKIHPLTPIAFAAAFFLGCGEYFSRLYFFIFLHELAHFLTALVLGEKPRQIRLLPYGCMMTLPVPPSEVRSILILLSGPLFNLALALFDICKKENLILALFNLMPVPPLDGGMIVHTLFPKGSLFVSIMFVILLAAALFVMKKPLMLPVLLIFLIALSRKHEREKKVIAEARKFIGKGLEKK